MSSRMIETLCRYASVEVRASDSNVDLARNTRGAQSAFGYTRPSSAEDRAAHAERQRRTQPLFHHVQAVAPIAAEILVAAVAGQRDRDVLARQLADPVGRDRRAVGIRLVVDATRAVHEVEVVARDVIDEMTGPVAVRHLLREAGLVERRIVERDRAGVHRVPPRCAPSSPRRRSSRRRPTGTRRAAPPRSCAAGSIPRAGDSARRTRRSSADRVVEREMRRPSTRRARARAAPRRTVSR